MIHDRKVVAELKLAPFQDLVTADHVIHDRKVVAELKQSREVLQDRVEAVIHDRKVVAELKLLGVGVGLLIARR